MVTMMMMKMMNKFNVREKLPEMCYCYRDYETNLLNNEVNIKN